MEHHIKNEVYSQIDKYKNGTEQEKILGFLDQNKLITATEGTSFFGQAKFYFAATDEGTKKVNEYIEELKGEWRKIIQFVTD